MKIVSVQGLMLLQSLSAVSSFIPSASQSNQNVQFSKSTSTCLMDAPEPLAEEGTWQAFLDEDNTGLIYYFDSQTGESLWEPPTETFPRVRLPRKKQRLADDLRKQYRKARQIEEQEVSAGGDDEVEQPKREGPSWMVGLLDREEKAVEPEVEEVVEEVVVDKKEYKQKDWFGKVFGEALAEESTEDAAPVEAVLKGKGLLESFGKLPVGSTAKAATAADVAEPEPKKKVVEKAVEVDLTPKVLALDMGSYVLPHPAKVRWGGEDALFTKGRTFGVFDGVSGADKTDGVPLYSRTLAQEMKKMVGTEGLTVQQMTAYMNDAANYADTSATGASTAIVASIGDNGFLQALNIGDSYCYVIRGGRITAKTREISHYWECPYQLSDDSPDRPKDGTKLNVELIAGDLVVMGSDGIFDNIGDDMLLNLIETSPQKPSQLAKKICDLSRKQSLDQNSITPYATQARRRGDPDYKQGVGGKLDDASCVVVACK